MIWLKHFCMSWIETTTTVCYIVIARVPFIKKNSMYHTRTNHIQLRYHFISSTLKDGVLVLERIAKSQNLIDRLTKSVPYEKLKLCWTSVGLLA